MQNPSNAILAKHACESADDRLASADAAWMTELATAFGGRNVDAVAATPEGQGEPGSRLRELFDAHIEARTVWSGAHEGKPQLG